jgi:hypothetical protein
LFNEPTLEQRKSFLNDDQHSIDYFRKSRNNFMKERLSIVKEEQFEENGRYFDFVDTLLTHLDRKRVKARKFV